MFSEASKLHRDIFAPTRRTAKSKMVENYSVNPFKSHGIVLNLIAAINFACQHINFPIHPTWPAGVFPFWPGEMQAGRDFKLLVFAFRI